MQTRRTSRRGEVLRRKHKLEHRWSAKHTIDNHGPYILHNQQYRALGKDDNVLDINLERSLEILKQPKAQFGNPILKTLGTHPDENKNITVHDGKYGPYVKCGKVMASIVGDNDIDNINLEEAIHLINERKAKIKNKSKKNIGD